MSIGSESDRILGSRDAPARENGLGFTIDQTASEIQQIRRLWMVLPELPLFSEWEKLVTTHRVSGKSTHDARLVATMRAHGINTILIFNTQDFARYPDILVLDPARVG